MEIGQLLINGIILGSVIALSAVGLTLTYGILRLSNFAHGDFMTLGAYLIWLFNSLGLYLWLSMILGLVVTALTMLISEWLIWKKMRQAKATSTTLTIISIGLALFIRNLIIVIWGAGNKAYQLPIPQALDIGGFKIKFFGLIIVILAALAILGLHLLLQYTKIGKAMRAVADDIDLARVSGINVEQVVIWTWIITGTLTALGGGLYGLDTGIRPNMGWFLILPMFASVILGGIGNPYGAIAGAFVIGIVQEVSVPWLGSDYKLAVALVIMMLILLFRPQGLFRGLL